MKDANIFFVFFCIVIGGCIQSKTFAPHIPPEEIEPSVPTARITQFSDALKNLGDLITAFKDEPFYLTVEPIENKTADVGSLPNDITMMVESALAKIGKNVVVIPYVSKAISLHAKRGHKVYIIHGAITEFDTNIASQDSWINFGVFHKNADGDGGIGADKSVSSITLDFTLMDFKSLHYIPGIQTSNSMRITDISRDRDIGFSIEGNGFGISGSASHKQGIHAILRLLVELSMVELIGTYKEYPYWTAILTDDIDSKMFDKMVANFERFSEREQIIRVQKLLALLSQKIIKIDGINGRKTKRMMIEYKKLHGIEPIDGIITTELYKKLLINISESLKDSFDN